LNAGGSSTFLGEYHAAFADNLCLSATSSVQQLLLGKAIKPG